MVTTEEVNRLKCERLVNLSWSKARLHYDDLKEIIAQGGPSNEEEYVIMMVAAFAALQKMTLDKADVKLYF